MLTTIDAEKSKVISEERKDPYFTTKYKVYEKPVNLREIFTDEEWSTATGMFHKPQKNKFVPENTSTLVSTEDQT